jgi:hypothetical protein
MQKTKGWNLLDLITSLYWSEFENVPCWPPDLFAICATVLSETGAYVQAVSIGSGTASGTWHQQSQAHARLWRFNDDLSLANKPAVLDELWAVVKAGLNKPLGTLPNDSELVRALIKLLGIADSASAGFGINTDEPSLRSVLSLLGKNQNRSLTKQINPDRARVLPKQHTPQSGLTLRSLSHHLCLIRPRGVVVRWQAPIEMPAIEDADILNLLICPWPTTVVAEDFRLVENSTREADVHRFFRYAPKSNGQFASELSARIDKAAQLAGSVHMVVFPELALDERELECARSICRASGVGLLAGV